jgi:tripartite ATP-independent transporter DctM subunit
VEGRKKRYRPVEEFSVEWWLILLIIFFSLFFLFTLGVPIGFAFLLVNMVSVFCLWNGLPGLEQMMLSIFRSVTNFNMLPVPLFILMGEIIFNSGLAAQSLDALDKWIGKIPGRLSLLAVTGGTLNAALSGSSMASTAMLATTLYPEMEKRGYDSSMSLGPLLGSGGLATMIPPSNLGVILAALAQISVGDMLIAIVIPGLLLSAVYMLYIVLRCRLQPRLAPIYDTSDQPWERKMILLLKYVLPLCSIVFLIIGLIYFGVATPTESAVYGVAGFTGLHLLYNGWKGEVIKKSLFRTIEITGMMFIILSASVTFSEILAYTGGTTKIVELFASLFSSPLAIVISMQFILFILGMFLESLPIMMITVPIFWPVLKLFHINPLWFAAIMLLNIEIGMISPPFGLSLFVLKGVLPRVTMGKIYRCAVPFVLLQFIVIALIILFPSLVLWLPKTMHP